MTAQSGQKMDSADTWKSALSKQRIMLGEHEKALRSLSEQQVSSNQHLVQVFDLLQNVHKHQSACRSWILPSANPPIRSSASHGGSYEPVFQNTSFPTPDHFSGDNNTNKCNGFLLQSFLAIARWYGTSFDKQFPFDSFAFSGFTSGTKWLGLVIIDKFYMNHIYSGKGPCSDGLSMVEDRRRY